MANVLTRAAESMLYGLKSRDELPGRTGIPACPLPQSYGQADHAEGRRGTGNGCAAGELPAGASRRSSRAYDSTARRASAGPAERFSARLLDNSLAMAEERSYPPSPEFVEHANVKGMDGYRALYKRAEEQPAEFWGELAEKELFWFEKWSQGLRMESAVRAMVRRRQDQRLLQLHRPPSDHASQEQSRDSVGRRAGRSAHDHLSGTAPPGGALRQRAEVARPQGRRPRHHLHADDSGAAHRHAGVRAAGHHSQRGVRRILGGSAQGAHSGPGSAGGDHRRRRLAARQGSEAEAGRR